MLHNQVPPLFHEGLSWITRKSDLVVPCTPASVPSKSTVTYNPFKIDFTGLSRAIIRSF
jgi:hypothetical protein